MQLVLHYEMSVAAKHSRVIIAPPSVMRHPHSFLLQTVVGDFGISNVIIDIFNLLDDHYSSCWSNTVTWYFVPSTPIFFINLSYPSISRTFAPAFRLSYPGIPPDSIWLARVTSLLHTSNCHFLSPNTPQCTRPVCIPTRMFTFTPVTSRTSLQSKDNTLNYW